MFRCRIRSSSLPTSPACGLRVAALVRAVVAMAVLALVVGERVLSEMPLRRIANTGASGTLCGSGTMSPADRGGGAVCGFGRAVAWSGSGTGDVVDSVSIGVALGRVKTIVHEMLKCAYNFARNR